jgi:hypothetical protein
MQFDGSAGMPFNVEEYAGRPHLIACRRPIRGDRSLMRQIKYWRGVSRGILSAPLFNTEVMKNI